MKHIIIVGAGTAGTMAANKLAKQSNKRNEWKITVLDQHARHYYQPGFLFYPFGRYEEKDLLRDRRKYIPKTVEYIQQEVEKIDANSNMIKLKDGSTLDYDLLVIATGSQIAPEEVPGMKEDEWHKSIFDFYTFEGASALREKLASWQGGKLVVHITEMPIKCPVAPLEFSFLADDFFEKKGLRDKVELKYVTPLSGAFTKPKAAENLAYLLKEKNIEIVPDFSVERIDTKNKKLISYDEREVDFDLLVTVPTNMGDKLIERSGLGDELNFVPTDHYTLQSKAHPNIFVVGDATNVPTSKAGSVAHFQIETLTNNIRRYLAGEDLEPSFDGHANCFVETGNNKALLLDFNYQVEPLEGKFPLPVVGPMKLLGESRINHIGKLMFKSIYWDVLMKGRSIPIIPNQMKMLGKKNKE